MKNVVLNNYYALTFHHNHVNIDGADGGLRQTLSLLQNVRDFSGWNAVVWFTTERHQLPDGHA